LASSTSTLITHQSFSSHTSSKTTTTTTTKTTNTPLHSQAASGEPHTSTSSSWHHFLPFTVPPSVPTSAPSSVTETSTVPNRGPSQKFSAHRSSDPKTQCPR
jgi:hypothetical protein